MSLVDTLNELRKNTVRLLDDLNLGIDIHGDVESSYAQEISETRDNLKKLHFLIATEYPDLIESYESLRKDLEEKYKKVLEHVEVKPLDADLLEKWWRPSAEKLAREKEKIVKEANDDINTFLTGMQGKYNLPVMSLKEAEDDEKYGRREKYQQEEQPSQTPEIPQKSSTPVSFPTAQEYVRFPKDRSEQKDILLELASVLMDEVSYGKDVKKWYGRVKDVMSKMPPSPEAPVVLEYLEKRVGKIGDDEKVESQEKRMLKADYDYLVELIKKS